MVAIPNVSSSPTFAEASQIIGTINTNNQTIANLLAPAGAGSMAGAIDLPAASSQINLLSITGGASGTGPSIVPGGPAAESHVNLLLGGKGTGTIRFANTGPIAANGTVAATFTATSAPTGASTSIQRWFVFVDSTGRNGYIPVF